MCGITGIVQSPSDATPLSQTLYDAMLLLQHRGQDAAGMATLEDAGGGHRIHLHKGRGMVRDAFRTRNMRNLVGKIGLAQVRYPTAGDAYSEAEAQPFYVSAPFGLVLVHNGNLTNAAALRDELFRTNHRHTNTRSDSEVLLGVLADELEKATRGINLMPEDVFRAVHGVHKRIRGSYAVIVLIAGHGLLAFRDTYGIRPLCLGMDAQGSQMLASESVALEGTGHKLVRDIAPGEAVFIDTQGMLHAQPCAAVTSLNPCIFEYVYLARPDSVMDGISVYQARLNMGRTLAKRVISTVPPDQIDVVIPIPESSRPSAMQLAQLIGKPYIEGFVKNRYVGRTFIMPGQAMRKKSVRQKLNAINSEFAGKNVLLVDDSIVRGTTSQEIVQMAREAGAKKVYLASAAPPVRFPNVYGIDMPSAQDLVANGKTVAEIEAHIGCDALIYQDLDAMRSAISSLNTDVQNFDASCFDGVYVTGDVDTASIAKLNAERT
ncbi:MAG: amidophosphoribosyltransferase [Cytophagales bacterium]|nr:amidophosphoribosyltransferase [Cytophagales bacterium]